MMKNNIRIFLLIPVLMFMGCKSDAPADTPTTGDLEISVDETLKPLIESEIDTFIRIYPYANIMVNYKSEQEIFSDLMSDSVRLIVSARNLNPDELAQFKKWEKVPKITRIAYDALALAASKDIKDSTITLEEIKSILSGTDNNSFRYVKIVFDKNNSSTVSYLKNFFNLKILSSNCFAVNSNVEVLNYVSKGENTIGIIGVNWVSDRDDSTNLSFLRTIKVLEVAENQNRDYFKPYQAYIAQKFYPLCRSIYMISSEAYSGLGTGFTAFVASERGQRIVLKYGLVPSTMPVRLIEIINEDI